MHELNKYSIECILEVSEDVTTIDVMLLVDCFVLFHLSIYMNANLFEINK